MKAIVCVDQNWGIGKNNGLLFHIPSDLEYFKQITLGKTIVMGGNTLLSLPKSKPLPGRTNIVLSDIFTRNDCTVCPDITSLFRTLRNIPSQEIFIVGGAMFYKTMIDFCDYALITKVKKVCEDATVFFPNLDKMTNWELVEEGDLLEENGLYFQYTKYKNNDTKVFHIGDN
ncbi:MAG: Dihydrofolate reductase [Firmicutes bacterium ADurb.Bin080]|jgi:dihydrofolate reductase|nr:dihydrofolate reductase [Clostridiales bacterium]OQC14599.1 MAG: Dihydrofolate reductase [Firmicutes bacterium ADurb.Bin080]